MTLEPIGRNSIRATLTADEMSGYHIDFGSMSVSDNATRTLLSDMLSVIEHMGLRHFGDRVTVECRQHSDGGCDMLFTVSPPTRWLFESCDDLFFAIRCKALPKQSCAIVRQGNGWLLTPKYELSSQESALLSEFCTPLTDIA